MMKILLVEDSKFMRIATERALVRAGYDVSTAVDGEQALQVAQTKLPDLILLDMLLPKLSGPEVLKALKSDAATAGIPVVVLTGLSPKNAQRLLNDGAFAFLDKAALSLDKGSEALLAALGEIINRLSRPMPRETDDLGLKSRCSGRWLTFSNQRLITGNLPLASFA